MSEALNELWQPRTLAFVPTSRKSLEEISELAREEGYAKGYAEGVAKGQQESKRQGAERAEEFASLWMSMSKPIADVDSEVSEYLLSLVLAVTKSILRRELITETSLIKETLESSLRLLSESNAPIEIRLNPQDKELVEEYLAEQRSDSYSLITDELVMRGGCLVTRGHALVDASIEKRCKLLIDQLVSLDAADLGPDNEKTPLDADVISKGTERLESDGDNDD
jgi:flagellar assembly protein FliH